MHEISTTTYLLITLAPQSGVQQLICWGASARQHENSN